jgi:predicted dehydrogenase
MGQTLKILVIGLGSIGRRHLKHLQSVGNIELAAFRTNKGERKEASGIQEFFSLEEALSYKPDGVIISNPTSIHAEAALPFLKTGAKVLIEKPIADSCLSAKDLEPHSSQIRVAYCMRFAPMVQKLTEIFEREAPFKVSFKRSFYLPKWHPYADYKKEYTARKELGGGVIRTLSHEIDLACYWFGEPASITGVTDRLSSLDIDTDDFAFFTLKAKSGARINFELDFFSPININEGEAFTSRGKYFWNTSELKFMKYDSSVAETIMTLSDKLVEQMYQNQMDDFLNFLRTGNSLNTSYTESILVLKIIDKLT